MLKRFSGEDGKRRLKDALLEQRVVNGNAALAEDLVEMVELQAVGTDEVLIQQGADDDSIYFIIAGAFKIVVNAKIVATRFANHVGEMAAIERSLRRSSSVVASEASLVAKLSESQLSSLGDKYPRIWRAFAAELAMRLQQRNHLVTKPHEKVRLFVISSTESLPIAEALKAAFEKDDFETIIWAENVFRLSSYSLDDLELQVDLSDFAVAIAEPDDRVWSRGKRWPAPRDNVIFELGLFMGRLSRPRAILMEPVDAKVKLPSDLEGVTTARYLPIPGWRHRKGTVLSRIFGLRKVDPEIAKSIASASDLLRKHINTHGMRT
jgi:CRP/FNR family cyclic AMP-dependent transcriptional regulator